MAKKALLALLILAAFAGLQTQLLSAQRTAAAACEGISVQIVKPSAGATLSGEVELEAHVSPSINLQRLVFYIDEKVIGAGQRPPQSSSGYTLTWDSSLVPNGTYRLQAVADFKPHNRPEHQCASSRLELAVNNVAEREASLGITISQPEWHGPVNVHTTFSAATFLLNADGSRSDVTPATSFKWSTTVGSLKQSGERAEFFSGSRVQDGAIRVVAHHAGQEVSYRIPISVRNSGQTQSYPSRAATLPGEGDRSDVESTTDHTSDPGLEECLLRALGEERYGDITRRGQRPSMAELERSYDCFAQRKFILPASFSPLRVGDVRNLRVAADIVRVSEVINVDYTDAAGMVRTGLRISGQAPADSLVLIYIFSDPLVLTTKSDSEGRWTYTLEEPLEAREHSVYVAVEGGTGAVRSVPFLISVVEAQATDDNPTGASLLIADTGQRPLQAYVVAAILLTTLGVVTALYLIMHRLNHPVSSGAQD